ncbi:hypothetical protein [Polaribacter porphyrae]|uniref:Uncharacterized protein n=1 Tax=Polaribacter porphyrae TaxID=1137780 RepID=A0A2S7WU33_9FLAO|nr:hypothetical protein [Polaribacter porphyrae]PQJ80831.1 hypothetical protein BTO18_17360 [Polaribacter porphyrae]
MKFSDYPAIKLYGELSIKRDVTEKEYRTFQRRIRKRKGLKEVNIYGKIRVWLEKLSLLEGRKSI